MESLLSQCGNNQGLRERTASIKIRYAPKNPVSQRVGEKMIRRDKMNAQLADLAQIIPTSYLKQNRRSSKIEKSDIVNMAIEYIKDLQTRINGGDDSLSSSRKEKPSDVGFEKAISETIKFLKSSEQVNNGESLCNGLIKHLHSKYNKLPPIATSIPSSIPSSHKKGDAIEMIDLEPGSSSPLLMVEEQVKQVETNDSGRKSQDIVIIDDSDDESSSSFSWCEMFEGDSRLRSALWRSKLFGGKQSNIGSQEVDGGLMSYNINKPKQSIHVTGRETVCGKPASMSKQIVNASNSSNGMFYKSAFTPVRKSLANVTQTLQANNTLSSSLPMSGITVPVLALHPSGQFYVPLTLDANQLLPYISSSLSVHSTSTNSPMLRPINILINLNV